MNRTNELRKQSLMNRRLSRSLSIGTSNDDIKHGISSPMSPLVHSPSFRNMRSPSMSGKRGSLRQSKHGSMSPGLSPGLSPHGDPLGREILGRLGELEVDMLHRFVKHWAKKQLKHAWTSWYNIDNHER